MRFAKAFGSKNAKSTARQSNRGIKPRAQARRSQKNYESQYGNEQYANEDYDAEEYGTYDHVGGGDRKANVKVIYQYEYVDSEGNELKK